MKLLSKESLRPHYQNIIANIATNIDTTALLNAIRSNHAYKTAHKILVYRPFKGEIDLEFLLRDAQHSGKEVFLPFFQKIAIYKYGDISKLECNDKPDIAFVPGLAFDQQHYRLGRGGGWYDRYFVSNPDIYKIGIAYQQQFCAHLPVNEHDIPMDCVITV